MMLKWVKIVMLVGIFLALPNTVFAQGEMTYTAKEVTLEFDKSMTLEEVVFKATYVINPEELSKLVNEARYSKDFPVKDSRKFKGEVKVTLSIPDNYLGESMLLTENIDLKKISVTLTQKFNDQEIELLKFKVAIGAEGKDTPKGKYCIKRVVYLPRYYPPKDWGGGTKAVPPGKNNPYGLYYSEILFVTDCPAGYEFKPKGIVTKNGFGQHSTNRPRSIGTRASHGCVRMHPTIAARLFPFILRFMPHEKPKDAYRGKEIYPFKKGNMIKVNVK